MNSVSFKQAAKMGATTTDNGMPAYESTGSALTDLFFAIGAARNMDHNVVLDMFQKAYDEDALMAMKILFWARDVRGGAGERKVFRDIISHLDLTNPEVVYKNLGLIPFFGRWDDVLTLRESVQLKELIADVIVNQKEGYQLAAKWMPRQGSFAHSMAKFLKISPKQWRKLLVRSSNTVEQKMCAQQWDKIEYSHLPSIAAKQYQAAFGRHDPVGYAKYKAQLETGEAKVNAGAIFPHDVIVGIKNGDAVVGQAQWDALPNFMGDNNALAMIDTSGSMNCPAGSSNSLCIDVAIALGLYVSEKQTGAFNGTYLTFSGQPELASFRGKTVAKKLHNMSHDGWEMNTNIESAFDKILEVAKLHKVEQKDMPKYLIILSDMQFDQCVRDPSQTAMEMMESRYELSGYDMPNVVFWNLNARGNVPVSFSKSGVACVSGFSPAIMKAVLAAKSLTPYSLMIDTINQPRYNEVTV
jgi:hypothetical protein